jgi:transposase
MCTYYGKKDSVMALDVILPFKAKYGRRIVRVLKSKGFPYSKATPNLPKDEVLKLERTEVPLE